MFLNSMDWVDFWFASRSAILNKYIATSIFVAIIDSNNTPPATRKISALRGVTCFWGNEK
ncbi:hypothetical protein EBI01_00780 [Marinomonas rhizomae]|uniref:Uncharacterized protein n=1 Tax=Marinomonas rhizomae TaxID=491948 RepID=A0A366JFB7_9GAMM|nr:hypothetical protein DFP80_102157 [Marinomonas rhizomae]RNF76265.1 hypothetical protein EBI01_00780 [Marinomonas rhizomae]